MSAMRLVIELDDGGRGYGIVHREGCRDVRDAYPTGEATSLSQVAGLIELHVGWEDDGEGVRCSPCVAPPKAGA